MDPERVCFLACGWSLASSEAHGTSIALQDEEKTVLVDAGGDAAKQLARIDGLASLDRIYLTHEHPDHLWSLPGLVHCLRFADRQRELSIAGPTPAVTRAQRSLEALGVTTPFALRWEAIDVEAGADDLAHWAPLDHGVETLGYRVGDVAVLGDTRPTGAAVELAADASILLHEASHTDEELCHQSGHSTPADAGRIAAEANVGLLALIHIHPSLDREEARQAASFSDVVTPVDGDQIRREAGKWKVLPGP